MCKCIKELEQKGFVDKADSKWDEEKKDFYDTPPRYFVYKLLTDKSGFRKKVDMYQCFQLNYCPACGEKIQEASHAH